MAGFYRKLRPSTDWVAITTTLIKQYQRHLSPKKGYQCACTQHGDRSCSAHALHLLQTPPLRVALQGIWQRRQHCQSLSTPISFSTLTKHSIGVAGLILLTGCGGGGGGGSSNTPTEPSTPTTPTEPSTPTTPTEPSTPASQTGKVLINSAGAGQAVSNVSYSITSATTKNQAQASLPLTSSQGEFTYTQGDQITLYIGEQTIGPMNAQETITQYSMADVLCSEDTCKANVQQNLKQLLLNTDSDQNPNNGYQIKSSTELSGLNFDLKQPIETFKQNLDSQLVAINITPSTRTTFTAVHGINTEELIPEGGINISGQAVLMADVFRHATPFKENSCEHITYDDSGWISTIPDECSNDTTPAYQRNGAITLMASNMPDQAIPEGEYTVLFEGEGELTFSGVAKHKKITQSGNTISVTLKDQTESNRRLGIRLHVNNIDEQNPIKNIRVVMPGGICTSNPFEYITDASRCLNNDYQSFASQLTANRNAIIFNPDYLKLLRNFKVVRAMNLMKASPRYSIGSKHICPDEATYEACMTEALTWDQRSQLDDAFWGATASTGIKERFGRGAPLEVIVELMNKLKADPWFTIPHSANDDYVRRFADYVKQNLHANAKIYLEYSNETWNGIFWAAQYARLKGTALGLDTRLTSTPNLYQAAYLYHALRSSEIFQLWETEFGDSSRFIRVLGGKTNDIYATRNMLDYLKTQGKIDHVDGVTIAPYFYGCQNRAHVDCTQANVPTLIPEAKSVDDVFSIIDNPKDPYGINSTIQWIQKHHDMVSGFGKKLYAYEGGQHLTVDRDIVTNVDEQKRLNSLFHDAQRDPRMKERYISLLQGWDDATGGKNPFTLYTMAQGYHDYGAFGLLEYLNQPRTEAPKFDAYMQYMEQK